ncbi:Holliday junction resolvase RuvX [Acidobacteria bacterium AH-259-G07]|nr:Holliday junction resolvase RuvX [Acidobacteria bacterium AH-259-G07]
MALDVGSKTIGVAVTDPLKITVRPLTTLVRHNELDDAKRICELIHQHQIEKLIVGMPRHLGGERSSILDLIEPLVTQLREITKVPVEWAEERLSTREAEKLMAEAGLTLAERRKKRNEFSAAVILQWYLEESS